MRDGVWGNLQQVYLQIHVNKVHYGLYIYQFNPSIGSLNLTMNTFPEYTRYFKFDFDTFPDYTRYFISYLFYMLSGRIEQLFFFHPDSHTICSNIDIQLLNNNCLNIS